MAEKLVDLKMSPAEAKRNMGIGKPVEADLPEYPWGTRFTLRDEHLKKMGLSAKDFEIGAEVSIVAVGRICEVSSRDARKPKTEVEIQMTKLRIEMDEAQAEKKAFENVVAKDAKK